MAVINAEVQTALIPEGTTAFIIRAVEEKISLGGNKYFKLNLEDLVSGGLFRENVSLGPTSAWKVNHLCDSVGLVRPTSGSFELNTGDLESRVGYARIKHTPSQKGDNVYPDIDRFLTKEVALEANPALADIAIPEDALTDPDVLRPARVRR